MSLSAEARQLHDQYEEAHGYVHATIDEAFDAVYKVFLERGFFASNSDPAEELVAALFKYFVDSALVATPEAA